MCCLERESRYHVAMSGGYWSFLFYPSTNFIYIYSRYSLRLDS